MRSLSTRELTVLTKKQLSERAELQPHGGAGGEQQIVLICTKRPPGTP
jgi:hypothetical protein